MLPKQYRLRSTREFSRVRRSGRSANNPLVALYVLHTRSRDIRVGFSVSKRVGNAVIRNRVKRRLREAIRPLLHCVRPGTDLVFIARPPSANASWTQILESVSSLLRKTGAVLPPHNA